MCSAPFGQQGRLETLEILPAPRAGAEIKRAEEEMAAGAVYEEADVRAALAARRR